MLPLGPLGCSLGWLHFKHSNLLQGREAWLHRAHTWSVIIPFCPPWSSSLFISILQLRRPNLQASPSSSKNENTDILSIHWLTISQEMQDFTAYKMSCFYFCLFTPPLFLTTILCSCQGKFHNLNHIDENKK